MEFQAIFSDYEVFLKNQSPSEASLILEKYNAHHEQLLSILQQLGLRIDIKGQLQASWNQKEASILQQLQALLSSALVEFSLTEPQD